MKTAPRQIPTAAVAASLTASIVLGLCSGCRPQRAGDLSGVWQKVGARDRTEFRDDRTITGVKEYGRGVRGRFDRVDADQIRMDMSVSSTNESGAVMVDNSSRVREVPFDGGILTRAAQGGGRVSYKRVP